MKRLGVLLLIVVATGLLGCGGEGERGRRGRTLPPPPQYDLIVLAPEAVRPPIEELTRTFGKQRDLELSTEFNASRIMLAKSMIGRRNDLLILASAGLVENAKQEKLMDEDTLTTLAYLVPTILVPKGNPGNVAKLTDLARPGFRLALTDPRIDASGMFGAELFEKAGLMDAAQAATTKRPQTLDQAVGAVARGEAGGTIAWETCGARPKVETVQLASSDVVRIAEVQAAVTRFTQKPVLAREYLDFVSSPEGRAVFVRHGYLAAVEAAKKRAPQAQIGGVCKFSNSWNP